MGVAWNRACIALPFRFFLFLVLLVPLAVSAQTHPPGAREDARDHTRDSREEAARDPRSVATLLATARSLIAERSIRGRMLATDLLERAVLRDPAHVEARLLLARLYEYRAVRSAVAAYERVLVLDSTNAEAWYRLGVIAERRFREWQQSANLVRTPEVYVNRQSDLTDYIIGSIGDEEASNFQYDRIARTDAQLVPLQASAGDDFARAVECLTNALRYDPENADAARQLVLLFTAVHPDQHARAAVSHAASSFPLEKEIQLGHALIQYRCGDFAAARAGFARAWRLMTARERRAYEFDGTLELLRYKHGDDIRRHSAPALVRVFREFWNTADPLYLTAENEAELEHFARIAHAELLFSRPLLGEAGWSSDRGKTTLRLGLPDQVLRLRPEIEVGGPRLNKTELWFYNDAVMSFTDEYNSGGFRFSMPLTGDGTQGGIDGARLYEDLARTTVWAGNPMYRRPALHIPCAITRFRCLESTRTSDVDLLVSSAVVMIPSGGATDAPAGDSASRACDGGYQFGFFLLDAQGRRTLAARDSLMPPPEIRDRNAGVMDTTLIHCHTLFSPPDSGLCSIEWLRPSDGAAQVLRLPFSTGRFDQRPALSDILLAREVRLDDGRPAPLRRHGRAIVPNPSYRISRSEQPVLYFEIYDLGRDAEGWTDFDLEFSIAPTRGGRTGGGFWSSLLSTLGLHADHHTRTTTGYRTDTVNLPIHTALDVQAFPAGAYELRVRLRDHIRDEERERSCQFHIAP
ncbi:MAG: GWxTD domain-containing protein [Bacteroidota bacterium]|jgi:GWxTD domain-containing protein|nr:GWxTD domain-containing protein [Bacteroidota bacterium]